MKPVAKTEPNRTELISCGRNAQYVLLCATTYDQFTYGLEEDTKRIFLTICQCLRNSSVPVSSILPTTLRNALPSFCARRGRAPIYDHFSVSVCLSVCLSVVAYLISEATVWTEDYCRSIIGILQFKKVRAIKLQEPKGYWCHRRSSYCVWFENAQNSSKCPDMSHRLAWKCFHSLALIPSFKLIVRLIQMSFSFKMYI